MADVKINRRHICGDDDFRVTSGDLEEESSQYYALTHDETDAKAVIGYGSKITNHVDPRVLADDEYFDLPSASYGTGFILIGDVDQYVRFVWNSVGQVTLIENTSLVDDANTDGYFCLYDTGDTTRISNRLGYAVRIVFEYSYSDNGSAPLFQVFNAKSGVDNLDPYLTINGTTVAPIFRYKGGDADSVGWDAWGFGEDTLIQSNGADPDYNDGSPGLGANDDAVQFNAGDYYRKTSSTTNQFSTGDIVVELVFKFKDETKYLFSTFLTNGLVVYSTAANTIVLYLDDAGGNDTLSTTGNLADETWYYAIGFVNRDEASTNGSQWYINGLSSGTGNDFSAISGSLSSTDFAIGAAIGGATPSTSTIAYIAAWEQASWHQAGASGPAEWATIAAERFAKLCGYYPEIASGTYTPTVNTRAFNAYLDKMEGSVRKLYYVGSEWLRMCHRVDGNGVNVRGYLSEIQSENLLTYSEDFSTWTLLDAGDTVTDNSVACPDGRVVAASFAADTDNGSHGLRKQPTLTAATYTFSFYAKPGTDATYGKSWIWLLNNTVGGCSCYFDIANGVKGTEGVGCTGYIEGPFYNGFYRCCIVFTGTAAVHDLRIYVADSDGDSTVQGDGSTPNIYVWGAQCEQSDYMSSPVVTTSAALTRLKDQLRYVAGDNIGGEDVGEGYVYAYCYFSDYDAADTKYLFSINDGGASADRVYGAITSADQWSINSRATAGNNGTSTSTGDVVAGVRYELGGLWDTDALTAILDDTPATPDADCDMPDDLDRMDIGMAAAGTGQLNGLIQNFRIYSSGGR